MIRSLRMRLFLGVTAVSVVVLAILSVAIDQAVYRTLQAEFDQGLLEKARALATMVEQAGDKTHFDYQAVQFPEFAPGPHAAYFEILLDGAHYQRSESLEARHLDAGAVEATPVVEPFTLPDGRAGRRLTMAFMPVIETDEPGVVTGRLPQCVMVIAQDSAALNRTLGRLRWLLFSLCAGATVLSGAALVMVANRAIRPVRALARQIESLRETDVSAALSGRDVPTELTPVVDRLNDLLRRVGEAFTRERAFTADVAHELRTPLAGLLATLQVARSRPRDAAAYEGAIDKGLVILGQMETLVENLLLLARAECGQLAVRTTAFDFSLLVQECLAAFHEVAAGQKLRFETAIGEAPAVRGDREMLRIVVTNLVDNAVSYAPAESVIGVRVCVEGGAVALEIENGGHALEPGDLPQLLKRFVRKDNARSATGVHAGLGLSICQRLLTLQSGRLVLRLDGARFVARVEVPVA